MLLLLLGKNNLLSSSVFSILVSTILLFPSHRIWIPCYDSTCTQHKFLSFALDSLAIVFLVCSCFSFCYCSVYFWLYISFAFPLFFVNSCFSAKLFFWSWGGGGVLTILKWVYLVLIVKLCFLEYYLNVITYLPSVTLRANCEFFLSVD